MGSSDLFCAFWGCSYLSGENFNNMYGSISNAVAMLNSVSKEIARTILGASIAPICCRLIPTFSASCSCVNPFRFR